MTFKIEEARKAGYTDDEILDYLSKEKPKFNVQKAKDEGYTSTELADYLSKPQENIKEPENVGRMAASAVTGALSTTPYGLVTGALELFGKGEALAGLEELEDNLPRLRKLFPNVGLPESIDREKFMEGIEQAASLIPTPQNIAAKTEEFTGLPLTPKTETDKMLAFISSATRFGTGSPQELIQGGLKAAAVKSALETGGIPEPVSDLLAYSTLFKKTPKTEKKEVKPSKKLEEKIAKQPEEIKPSTATETSEAFPKTKAEIPKYEGPTNTAEEALTELQKPKEVRPEKVIEFPEVIKEEHPSLTGRVSQLEDRVENLVSKQRFKSDAQAGRTLEKDVKKLSEYERKPFEREYKKSDKALEGKEGVFTNLVKQNEELISSLKQSGSLNTGEQAVLNEALNLRAMIGKEGEYIATPYSKLIKTANSISGRASYEMPYIGPKGLLRKMVRDINRAVIDVGKANGLPVNHLIEADKLYGQWADKFLNDEVSTYLEKTIRNPEALFQKAVKDKGVFRALKDVLEKKSPQTLVKIEREIAGQMMEPYIKNMEKVGSSQYTKDLANLKELVGTKKANKIDRTLRSQSKFPRPQPQRKIAQKERGELAKERITSATEKKASEYVNKTKDQIHKMMDSPEGIRKLKKELKDQGKSELFDKLVKEKTSEIFRQGKVEAGKPTGNDLYQIVNDVNNYDLLVEMYGKEAVNENLTIYKEIGKKEVTKEKLYKVAKNIVKVAGASKIIHILGPLL